MDYNIYLNFNLIFFFKERREIFIRYIFIKNVQCFIECSLLGILIFGGKFNEKTNKIN